MDMGRAFKFVFEDPEWIKKILLGSLIALIPIFGPVALMGYGIVVIRNVMQGEPHPLPDWDRLGEYFTDGLKLWIVMFIYSIPILILMCPAALVGTLPALGGESEELTAVLDGLSIILVIGVNCLSTAYGLVVGFLTPIIQIRYAETREIGPCLRVGEIFRLLLANIGPIFITMVVIWLVAVFVFPIAVIISLGLLILPLYVWITVFTSHLYGQIGRQVERPVI